MNFTQSGKRFALGLHKNGSNSFLFVNTTKICQFKAMEATVPYLLILQIYVNSKQKTLKWNIIHCGSVMFQKNFQLII